MQGPLMNALSDKEIQKIQKKGPYKKDTNSEIQNLQQLDESLQFSGELLTPNQQMRPPVVPDRSLVAIPSLPRDEQE